jgi:hypothetical protein
MRTLTTTTTINRRRFGTASRAAGIACKAQGDGKWRAFLRFDHSAPKVTHIPNSQGDTMNRTLTNAVVEEAVANGERLAEPLVQQAERLKRAVGETIDDQLRIAKRSLRRARHATEDLTDDLRMQARREPLKTLGIALAAGAVIGLVLGWSARAERR